MQGRSADDIEQVRRLRRLGKSARAAAACRNNDVHPRQNQQSNELHTRPLFAIPTRDVT